MELLFRLGLNGAFFNLFPNLLNEAEQQECRQICDNHACSNRGIELIRTDHANTEANDR